MDSAVKSWAIVLKVVLMVTTGKKPLVWNVLITVPFVKMQTRVPTARQDTGALGVKRSVHLIALDAIN